MTLLFSSMLYLLSLSAGNGFNNATDSTHQHEYDYYMHQSKKQQIAGTVFLATGIAGGCAVLLFALLSALGNTLVYVASLGTYQPKKQNYTLPLLIVGALIGAGISFFLAANQNRKIAKSLSVDVGVGNTSMLRKQDFKSYAYPTLSLKFRL